MDQRRLIELVATFNYNNPSFARTADEQVVNTSTSMMETFTVELRKQGVPQETIDAALEKAFAPRHSGQEMPAELRLKHGLY